VVLFSCVARVDKLHLARSLVDLVERGDEALLDSLVAHPYKGLRRTRWLPHYSCILEIILKHLEACAQGHGRSSLDVCRRLLAPRRRSGRPVFNETYLSRRDSSRRLRKHASASLGQSGAAGPRCRSRPSARARPCCLTPETQAPVVPSHCPIKRGTLVIQA